MERDRLRAYLSKSRHVYGLTRTGAFPLTLALDAAQKAFGISGHVAEIGTFYGKYFILLALLAREDETAVGVDCFTEPLAREGFYRNLENHLSEQRYEVLEQDSRTLSAQRLMDAAGGKIRLFSVDGAHDAETVYHDLKLARDTLAEGGVVIADDYFLEGYPGVSEAVVRLFLSGEQGPLVPFAIGGNKLLLGDAAFAERYADALRRADLPARLDSAEMLGHPVVWWDFSPVSVFGLHFSPKWTRTGAWRAIRSGPIGHLVRFRLRRL